MGCDHIVAGEGGQKWQNSQDSGNTGGPSKEQLGMDSGKGQDAALGPHL